jgi:DNA-binding transcriptional ArsR family regulator
MDFHRPMQVVTPTLDADVLSVLARADVELTGREIQRLAGHGSHQGIRNAADRLTREGILERRPAGNANLYRLNRDHIAAQWIEKLATLPEQIVERLREAIAGWILPPVLAMLFGSVATGQATSTSDLDLLIVRPRDRETEDPTWSRQLGDLQALAASSSGNDARILEYGQDELTSSGSEAVLSDALRDGIELYGSRRVLRDAGRPAGAR